MNININIAVNMSIDIHIIIIIIMNIAIAIAIAIPYWRLPIGYSLLVTPVEGGQPAQGPGDRDRPPSTVRTKMRSHGPHEAQAAP